MKVVLGIDTSCYTTSIALMSVDGTLLADARRPLKVRPGGKGLAQSEMVYQHTRNLPEVFAEANTALGDAIEPILVGVSVRPRPLADSYMPAFLVGEGYAKVLALSHGVALCPLSHQENHILAGVWSAGGPSAGCFLAVHVSGGTTEVTKVAYTEQGLAVTLVGSSIDIAAGQFVDRVGVTMGLPFPAGPHLELLAQRGRDRAVRLPLAVKAPNVSFSGPETQAQRMLAQGTDAAAIAAGVELCIADSLVKIIQAAITATESKDILIVGGVAANAFIRDRITEVLSQDAAVRLYFPRRDFSSDNAVGAAYFAVNCLHNPDNFRI